jgi:hypothetical protein
MQRHGPKTTEFWLTLAFMGVVVANGTDFINIPWQELMALGLGSGAYAVSRGIKKMGSS